MSEQLAVAVGSPSGDQLPTATAHCLLLCITNYHKKHAFINTRIHSYESHLWRVQGGLPLIRQ